MLRPGEQPVVLLGAGIGATPLLAMRHELGSTASHREVWWLYGTRSRGEHPYAMESRALIKLLRLGRGYICHSRPSAQIDLDKPSMRQDGSAFLCSSS